MYTFGRTNVTHSDACRRRIQELMKEMTWEERDWDASRKRKASSQTFERDTPPMPRVGQESGPDDQLPVQEESTRHEGGDGAEIPAAQGSGDPDQSRMDMSEGAASSSGQGSKRTASQAGLPENADVSFPQGTKRVGSESTESGIEPDTRRQKIAEGTTSTVRNDADSDVQVTDANTSSFEGPIKWVEFNRFSMLERRKTHSTRSGS